MKFTSKERDAETGMDYFGARYMSAAQGRFTSPDQPFADQHIAEPQSWNLYSYARNNPLKFIDDSGTEVRYASEKLEVISNTLRAQSPTYNTSLSGYEGLGASDLVIGYGNTGKDPDGSATVGLTHVISRGGPELVCDGPACAERAPFGDQLKRGVPVEITINDKIRGDVERTTDVLGHEVTHANDARTKTSTYVNDPINDAKGKVIPHDSRRNEKVAIAGEKKIKKERQDFGKTNPQENKRLEQETAKKLKELRE